MGFVRRVSKGVSRRIRRVVLPQVPGPGQAGREFARASVLSLRSWDQISNATGLDRYPEIFRCAADALEDRAPSGLRVLSYGCSTGEECLTLRGYFPDAVIVGTDVNPKNLAVCEETVDDDRIAFCVSGRRALTRLQGFDAIFAMSVLCRWPQTRDRHDVSRVYPFRRFSRAVALLDSLLRVGGILSIANANYRFTDSETSARYESLPVPGVESSGFVTIFDPDGRRADQQTYDATVFRKLR